MLPNSLSSWLIYIVIALLLGAIGTGLWEWIIKPLLTMTASSILKILSFGINSVGRKLYVEIAKRSPHRANLFIIGLICLIFAGLIGISASRYMRTAEKMAQPQLASIEELAKVSPQLASDKLSKLRKEAEDNANLYMLFLSCFGLVFISYHYFKYLYILSAINYFERCMYICGPYLKDSEEKQFISDFALITSENEFNHIINRLGKIVEENNKHLPPFTVS